MPVADGSMPDEPGVSPRQHPPPAVASDETDTLTASPDAAPKSRPNHANKFALLTAVAGTVLGAKLVLIATLGSPMPLIDQWDAEAANLYAPYLHGSLSFGDLFAPHNEHRIVLTRLLTLLHLELAGEWNPRLEMILSAILHTAFITWLCALLMPLVGPHRRMLFACFTALVFALPLGYENTLLGFNFHFYLTLLFGVATIVCFASACPFSWRWFIGLTLGVFTYLSFSSGVAAIFAAAILVGLQLATNVRSRSGREFAGLGVMVFIAAAMVLWEASVASSSITPWAFIQGFLLLAGPTVIGVILIQVPTMWFCRHVLAIRPAVNDRAWVAVGVAGWVIIQLAIVAYGRGTAVGGRYIDLLLPVYPVALIAVFSLAAAARVSRLRRDATKGAVTWVFAVVALTTITGYYVFLVHAIDWHKSADQQLMNAKAYLTTHDAEILKKKYQSDLVDVSYPNPARLAHILDNSDVRAILPPEIRPAAADNAGARNHMLLKGSLANVTAAGVRDVLPLGPAVLAVGVALFFSVSARDKKYKNQDSKTSGNGKSKETR